MASAKKSQNDLQAPLEMFLEKFDLTQRTIVHKPYSWLQHKLDTRIDGAAKAEFADELLNNFKDKDHALNELLKYPIEVTGDGVPVVGRALAKALSTILVTPGDTDPEIPFEVYDAIPNYDKLSDRDKAGLRLYAVSKDERKDKQRGLTQADRLFNARAFVTLGWSKDKVIAGLVEAGVGKWKAEELYSKAKNSITNQNLAAARAERKELQKAHKPVNAKKLCEKFNLEPTARNQKLVAEETDRGGRPNTITHLIKKQQWIAKKDQDSHYSGGNPQSLADNNIEWYRRTATNSLRPASDDAAAERPLPAENFIKLTRAKLGEALKLANFWQDAMNRAEAEVDRLEPVRKLHSKASRFQD
jgi:hypothetical protein